MKIPARWQQKIDRMEALSGLDPDASPNMADFIAPDSASTPQITQMREDATFPNWRSVAGVIRQGRKFGIEYPASTSPETRADILRRGRELLPYAFILDEGEGERVTRWPLPDEEPGRAIWRVGIVARVPGYGISDAEIEAHREDFLASARDFRRIGDELLQTLLRVHDISLDTLPHLGAMAVAPGGAAHGHGIIGHELEGWRLQFQLGAVFFTHLESGQEVRVSMNHREVGGVLHGYGWSRFVKTTPQWNHLAPLLRDDYFDARRVIEFFHQQGCWETVPLNLEIHLLATKALAAPLSP